LAGVTLYYAGLNNLVNRGFNWVQDYPFNR